MTKDFHLFTTSDLAFSDSVHFGCFQQLRRVEGVSIRVRTAHKHAGTTCKSGGKRYHLDFVVKDPPLLGETV